MIYVTDMTDDVTNVPQSFISHLMSSSQMIDNAALAVPEVANVAGKIAQAVEEDVLAHTTPLILSGAVQGAGLRSPSQLSEVLHVPQGNGPQTERVSHIDEVK
jgi:hypothetical protein